MMDAYSFDRTKEEMHENFNKMHNVYENIFKRLGFNIVSVISDGGTMGGKVSEEFQAITSLGEDVILYDEEKNIGINKEVLELNDESYINGIDLSKMKEVKAIELGNNFELGTKYSESMQLFYTDENGQNKPYYMGCYGIGLGRIIALIIENNVIIKNNEFKGFVLPYNISHYKVQIIYNENNKEKAFELYNELLENNINAIIDDRENINIGARINDVYAIGTPKIIVFANKFNGLEYEIEDSKTNEIIKIECSKITEYFNNL